MVLSSEFIKNYFTGNIVSGNCKRYSKEWHQRYLKSAKSL